MSKIKDAIIEEQDTGIKQFTPRTEPQQVQDWFRNKREELGINERAMQSNEQAFIRDTNPFDR